MARHLASGKKSRNSQIRRNAKAKITSEFNKRDTSKDTIRQLQATNKSQQEALEEIIIQSGKVDINNWPAQQQICQSIAQQALKESKDGKEKEKE